MKHQKCKTCGRPLSSDEWYRGLLLRKLDKETRNEVEYLALLGRSRELSDLRKMLVVKLRSAYKLDYSAIGLLISRDHSTVMYLYRLGSHSPNTSKQQGLWTKKRG